ncbi:MAG TPA: GGDEF domain-containing protein [Dissulfurispiraceae bacterium]|nr:GGDEF domain-containing protein [Dissulfurispiraceae bacterium]
MSNPKTVVVISKDQVLTSLIGNFLKGLCQIVEFATLGASLDYMYSSNPGILLIDITSDDPAVVSMLNDLKSDPVLGHLSVFAVLGDAFVVPGWDYLLVDDYLRRSALEGEIRSRIELSLQRVERAIEVNPLTGLPGNIQITKQIQKRLNAGDKFALAYADLDFFKPYNDRYGFSRGDEVLKMLGRLILNTVKDRQPHGSFVGHIGGDDIVFIMDCDAVEEASDKIIGYFDSIIPTFYDMEERTKGFIEATDREGQKKVFPLISISIGIVSNDRKHFAHYGEMAEVASEMKKFAKTVKGSCFRVDKRNQSLIK